MPGGLSQGGKALGSKTAVELKERLLERIRSDGPISFAEFMEAALYDPEDGFYARPAVGVRSDRQGPDVASASRNKNARNLAVPGDWIVGSVGRGVRS